MCHICEINAAARRHVESLDELELDEWFGDEDSSTRVFRFLTVGENEQVGVDERERLAAEIGGTMERLLA